VTPKFRWTTGVILRGDVRRHPDKTYLFGDNAVYRGMGGMAREMRGEVNAVGVPTKWTPSMNDAAFFSDDDESGLPQDLMEAAICDAESRGLPIVVPSGIGRGLAQMPQRCPRLYKWLCERLHKPKGV
jgi:hypothetical protein